MDDLKLEIKSFSETETCYTGTYKSKQFEMIVNYCDDHYYSMTKGNLTKEEWDEVITKHYYGDYK